MSWPGSNLKRHEPHFGDRTVLCYAERPASLDAMFREALTTRPDGEAVASDRLRLTYAELDAAVERLASALARLGLGNGERLISITENRAEILLLLLATARLGAIFVPVNVRESAPGIAYLVADCTPRILCFDASSADRLPSTVDAPSITVRIDLDEEDRGGLHALIAESDASPPAVTHDEEDAVIVLYTSGTTGPPKGAMVSHLNVVHTATHFCECWRLGPDDRAILAVPASHVTGLVAILATMVRAAGCTVTMRRFEARAFLDLAEHESLTYTVLVPAMYNLCLLRADLAARNLGRWRVGGFGGAPMPAATVDALAEALPHLELLNAYGSTECTSATHLTPPGRSDTSGRSVGTTVPCCEQRIVDDAGRELPAGEVGEVWLRGPNTVRGYWGKPDETARSFSDGFWHSGDLACRDAEGYLYLFDRKKDVVNRGGYKVSSAELENTLMRHPEVVDAAVVGHPDPVVGEKAHAFVVRTAETLDDEAVREFCRGQVADYMVPDYVTFLSDALPRNANGKLQKQELRAMIV